MPARNQTFRVKPLVAAMLAVGAIVPAQAANFIWIGPTSGANAWNTAAFWQPADPSTFYPGSIDTAVFNTNASFTDAIAGGIVNNGASVTVLGTNNKLYGPINNSGVLTFGATGNSAFTGFYADSTFTGGGQTVLLNPNTTLSLQGSLRKLTIDAGYTVRGTGSISSSNSNGILINNGTISAEGSGMRLNSLTVDNSNGVIKIADGATLTGSSSTFIGGTIQGATTSQLGTGATFKNTTLAGNFTFEIGSIGLSRMNYDGTIINNGSLFIGKTGTTFSNTLYLTNGTVLAGTGQTVLNDDQSYLTAQGPSFTIAAGHTVRGLGYITSNTPSNQALIHNQGTIWADGGALGVLQSIDNSGTVKVSDGATISIFGLSGGTIQGFGSARLSSDGTAAGGTLFAVGDTTFAGSLNVYLLNLTVKGTINNTGTLTLGKKGENNALAYYRLSNGTTLTGAGQTVMNSLGAHVNLYDANSTATLAADHTLRGSGAIDGAANTALVNKGTIIAENGVLTIATAVRGDGTLKVAASGAVAQTADIAMSRIEVATGGTYLLQSGLLEADTFTGVLTQTGGTFGAGIGLGAGELNGNYSLRGGNLAVTLGGNQAGSYDQLNIGGNLSLAGGGLTTVLANNYGVQAGDVLNIVSVRGTRSGTFTGMGEDAAISVGGKTLNLTYAGGDGNDIALVSKVTAGSRNLALGGANANTLAYFVGNRAAAGSAQTTALKSLDLLAGAKYAQGKDEILRLDAGKGTLNVVKTAIFTSNGTNDANMNNGGLVRVPVAAGPLPSQGFTVSSASTDTRFDVTGQFAQQDGGQLRLFVAGTGAGAYSQLASSKAVSLDGELQIVLRPEMFTSFGYQAKMGDTFDFIVATGGITLTPGLDFLFFSTAEGLSRLKGLTFSQYASGVAGDPDDNLYRIAENLFNFQLADNGTVLRATLMRNIDVTAVPEPEQYLMLLFGAALVGWLRRREAYGTRC